VFRYEALAPRQTLRAHVLVSERGAEILKNLLGDGAAIALGKSRTAGYGRAQAKCVSDAASLDGWNELGDPVASAAADGKWRLTLLSDALLRDAGGRQSASGDAVKAALADALGVAVDKIVVTPRYVTVRTVGGFNRTWGLPLAQATAARMGSEYEVESDALTAEQARQLEQHGIGERRADGFGRIALRPAGGAATLAETKGGEAASSKKTLAVDAPGRKTAEVMLERMLRHMLDRKVTEKALQISEYVKRPTVSQLKRLQAIVRNELTEVVRANGESVKVAKAGESTVRLKNYMTHLGQRPSIKRLFDAGRLPTVVKSGASTASLNEWLDHRFSENDDEIDTLLGMKDEKLPEIGGVQAKMTTHLRREYSLRLVHAVLGLAAKNKRRSGEERR
jgi:CRISPR-associated protein Csx10